MQATGLAWLIQPGGKISHMPIYLLVLTMIYLTVSNRMRQNDDGPAFVTWGTAYRWGTYFFALACILLLGKFGATQFIYFQF